ncbi:two-component sensor histidine kinase, partial [Stenotrophomonas maltophilia]
MNVKWALSPLGAACWACTGLALPSQAAALS